MNTQLRKLATLFLVLVLASTAVVVLAQGDAEVETVIIDEFDDGVPLGTAPDGAQVGFAPWSDGSPFALDTLAVEADSDLALPDQEGDNNVLSLTYDIAGWAGFTHVLTDGTVSPDWTTYDGLSFWLYGNETDGVIQVEIHDNRNPDMAGDTAERFYYRITDDFEGWEFFSIPFDEFQRRTDWQPGGAPNDGLTLSEVSGYSFGMPAGTGDLVTYLDKVGVYGDPEIIEPFEIAVPVVAEPTAVVTPTEVPDYPTGDWALMWSDEFDEEAGTPPDPNNWTCEIGGWGWGNEEWEYYTDRPENVSMDGESNLVITAREESVADEECWYGECTHTSARCITMDNFEFTYGKVEARLRLPYGQGIWPAFWMLGANFEDVGWPASGEIDIMENIGSEPTTTHGTIHGPGYSGGAGIGAAYEFEEDVFEDYHVFGIEWEPQVIRWYVDGELFNTITLDDLEGRRWVFDHDFFLIMNVAVGGFWPGYPDETTEFPQTMLVDWVRVYQRQDE